MISCILTYIYIIYTVADGLEALMCKAGVQGIEFHFVFPLYFSNTEAAVQRGEKGAGSEASHLRSCGNMAQDVLPWQPSSTDPLMGCLVCQCDIC